MTKKKWNVGKELSENYEFMTIAFYGLKAHQKSEKAMVNYVRKTVIVEDARLFEKPLGSDMLRMLNRETQPLNIVIKAHLFIEHFIDVIIQKKFKNSQLLLQNTAFSFAMKIDMLWAKNYLDAKLYNDIRLLNRLRNKYAHNLYYDLDNFDVTTLSYCDEFNHVVQPPTKTARVSAKIYMLKIVLYYLLLRLTKKYPFITKVEIPNNKG